MAKQQIQKLELSFLISFLILLFIIYSDNYTSISDGYLPALTDEYRYYGDACAVGENGLSGSAFLIHDQVSGIGEFGSHGFAYGWLNGIIYFASGKNPLSMPLSNLIYLSISFLFIMSRRGFTLSQKLQYSSLLFSLFIVIIFVYSYMQETIHVFFAVIIGFSLIDLYNDESRNNRKIIIYTCLVLIATIFRINWVFWLFGLIPVYKEEIKMRWLFLSILFAIILIFFSFKLIYATFVFGFLYQLLELVSEGKIMESFSLFFSHAINNTKYYFRFFYFEKYFPYYYYGKMLILGLGLYLFKIGLNKKRGLFLGFGYVVFINLAALIFLYDSYDWRELRALAPVIYIGLLLLVFQGKTKIIYPLLVLQIMMLIHVLPFLNNFKKEHQDVYLMYTQQEKLKKYYSELENYLDQTEPVTVLLSSDFTKNNSILTLVLPYKNKSSYPIRYSMHFSDEIESVPGFGDYLLTVNEIRSSNQKMELITRNEYYVLYKLIK